MLLQRLHELARIPHPLEERPAIAAKGGRVGTLRKIIPLLHHLIEAGIGKKRGNPADDLSVINLLRVADVDEDVEVIRHHAVGQELHARKPRDAPDEVHKPRTLPVIEKERTMGNTTRPSAFRSAAPHPSKRFAIVGGYDQVITPVGKVDARFPHAGNYTTNKIYCGNLLWQSSLTLHHPTISSYLNSSHTFMKYSRFSRSIAPLPRILK